jgi:hypothetical protein
VARCGLLQLGPLAALPGGQALGAPFKDLGWRVQPPAAGAGACVTPGPGVGPLSPN